MIAVEVEPDDFQGFHAVVVDSQDRVMFITDSFPIADDAFQAALEWLAAQRQAS